MYFVIFHIRNGQIVRRIYADMAPYVEARAKAYATMPMLLPGESLRIFGNGCFIEEFKK